ncbi:MAG TPA: hypothetical protein PLG94_16230 [Smithellaceae bacterium]|nr:hypothetical protein [Smithellaceae bacterium]HPL68081.1 hypothetical protein [Smithellaceae bacterium]
MKIEKKRTETGIGSYNATPMSKQERLNGSPHPAVTNAPNIEVASEELAANLSREPGWNQMGEVSPSITRWAAFERNLAGANPLGFYHEYHDTAVVRDVHFHNLHMTFAYVLALAAQRRSPISVLDWGGGLGHYFRMARAVCPDVELDYHCKDLPIMVAAGKSINPEIVWHTDDGCLSRRYDLVMLGASLQCMPDWRTALPRIAASAQDILLLTRIPVVRSGPSYVAVLRDGDMNQYHQHFAEREVLDLVESAGLSVFRELVIGHTLDVKGAPEPCDFRGWIFRRPRAVTQEAS